MFKSLFKKAPESKQEDQQFDSSILDESLKLLKATTLEVSEAAVSASQVLEERLRKSERRFYAVIDAIPDIVIVKDGKGRWKTMNTAGQDLFGWHHGEYHDLTSEDLSKLYPSMKGALNEGDVTDKEAWKKGSVVRFQEEITINNKSGYIDILKTPVYNEDGSRKELIIIGRDITHIVSENKRNKACFTALNTASDIIFIADKKGEIYFCNDMFVSHFKFESYTDAVGQQMVDILGIKKFDKQWKTLKQNKTWSSTYEDTHTITIVPMMNCEPDPQFFIGTMKPLNRNK